MNTRDLRRDLTEAEERELIESSERGEWISTDSLERDIAFRKEAANQTLKPKRQRISISIPERVLRKLKAKAAQEGMPYQTLINSILHKYVG